MTTQKQFKVTLVKSMAGSREKHRASVRGLGLTKIGQSVVVDDTPSIRGMAVKAAYLLRVEG